MAGAYVLATVEPGYVKSVLDSVRKIRGVLEAHAVTGPYDIIARVEGESADDIGRSVVSEFQSIEGVERTLTTLIVEI
jgi:DNA-binding Lrp family transcriptional regulator